MPLGVDQNVFRLEVSKQDVLLVNVLDSEYQLCADEPGKLLFEELVLIKLLSKISILTKFNDHVEVLWGLKGIYETKDVAVVEVPHDLCFSHRILDLVVLHQLRFLHGLHRVDLPSLLVFDSENLTEGAFSQHL